MIGFKILSTVAVLALVAAPAASFAQNRGKGGAARGAVAHAPGGGGGMRAGGAGARGFSGGGGGARFSGGGYRGGYANRGGGGAVVPGLIAGAVIGGALASGGYYGGPGYYASGPGYYDDQYDDGPVAVAPQAGGDDSVGYCMQTYRSYDPRSGTYLGNDGYRHPCP
jgi:BA14K-like protein